VRDDFHYRQFLLQHQCGRFFLDVHSGTVAAKNFLFVYSHSRGRKANPSYGIVGGKKQDTSTRTRRSQSFFHHRRMRDRYQNRIRTPSLSSGLDLFHKLTICGVKRLDCASARLFARRSGIGSLE